MLQSKMYLFSAIRCFVLLLTIGLGHHYRNFGGAAIFPNNAHYHARCSLYDYLRSFECLLIEDLNSP